MQMASDSYVVFTTSFGNVVVELYNQSAPLTVANFLGYVTNPTAGASYANSFFHRLVAGFVLQGGGYDVQSTSVGTITAGAAIASEASAANPNVAGTIAMALSTGPNSATDQYFFNLADNSSLLDGTSDGGPFTVFGKVVENYSVITTIAGLSVVNAQGAFNSLPVQGTIASGGVSTSNLIEYNIAVVQPISGTKASQPTLDDKAATPFASVALADPGDPTGKGAGDTVQITVKSASGTATSELGTLSLPANAAAGLTLTSTGAGVYLLGGTTAIATLQAALDALVFTPTLLASQSAPVAVTFNVALEFQGGSQGSVADTATSLVVTHDAQAVATPTNATVAGADGTPRTLTFSASAEASLAGPLLAGIVPASALYVDSPGSAAMTSTQTAVIDSVATGATSVVGNGVANETIAAGAGAFSFIAGIGGSGSLVAGGGSDFFYNPAGGNWQVALGAGVDTVVLSAGNNTVSTGTGGSLLFLGAGANSIASGGADTVVGSTGAATVSAIGGTEVFSLGGPLDFVDAAGANTVVAGAVAATLYGGAGNTLAFTDGATSYVGAAGTDTLVGLAGSITVQSGAGGGLFFGGTAGANNISAGLGNVTAFGAGAGDVLAATGAGTDVFAGGVGAETLSAAGSTGNNTFFAGFGPETLIGGSGTTALVASAEPDLLVGGTGLTLFQFIAGRTGGADTISGFDPTHDFVKLAGYAVPTATVLQNATISGGAATIALSDGTQIVFAGVTQLNAASFI